MHDARAQPRESGDPSRRIRRDFGYHGRPRRGPGAVSRAEAFGARSGAHRSPQAFRAMVLAPRHARSLRRAPADDLPLRSPRSRGGGSRGGARFVRREHPGSSGTSRRDGCEGEGWRSWRTLGRSPEVGGGLYFAGQRSAAVQGYPRGFGRWGGGGRQAAANHVRQASLRFQRGLHRRRRERPDVAGSRSRGSPAGSPPEFRARGPHDPEQPRAGLTERMKGAGERSPPFSEKKLGVSQ